MFVKNKKQKIVSLLSSGVIAFTGIISGFTHSYVSAAESLTYGDALKLSLYFYDANQCGMEVDNNPLTWRSNCHTYDAQAPLSNAVGLTDTEKNFIKNANGGSDTVDVSGGYHDAGDHVKPSVTMGFSCTSLAWSYYSNPDAYINTDSRDHLFDILKNMCDYFMKVTYLDDNNDVVTFCYIVSDKSDHDLWQSPETQTYNRPTYWATPSHPSADAAGEMAAALASSSMALREVDSAYADKCLIYAEALRDFAQKYPGASYEGVAGMYESSSQLDDIAWGDLWCHLAGNKMDSYSPIPVNSDGSYRTSSGTEYDGWIYSWGKVWGGYSTLLYSLGYEDYGNTVLNNMNRLLSNPTTGNYFIVADGWGSSRHSCAWQMYSLNYAAESGQTKYAENAKTQMDYLLGVNPDSRSYLIGFTDNYPKQIHHRAANPDKGNAKYVIYGALVGGPTDNNGSYTDYYDSYSCTEPALDYNGNFSLAIAGLCSAFGSGDGSGADKIIVGAAEIDETYQFGAWYEPQPEHLMGDVNLDGEVTIADAVMLQKWLLCVGDLTCRENADLCKDERIDVFDLCLLKRMLIAKMQ